MSPVRDRLRDRPERKPIIMENYYAALNYTDTLETTMTTSWSRYNYTAKRSQSQSMP